MKNITIFHLKMVSFYNRSNMLFSVFDILLTYINTKDWKKALLVGVPKRKGYVVKDLPDT